MHIHTLIINTPLEQFDQVNWAFHNVLDTVESYSLSVFEIDFDASSLYINTFYSNFISFSFLYQIEFHFIIVIGFFLFLSHYAPIMHNQVYAFINGFTHLFILGTIHLFTSFCVIIWFTDFFYMDQQIITGSDNLSTNYILAPQITFTYEFSEILILLAIVIFFINSWEGDEYDNLDGDAGDPDLITEIVAPIFVANLGKSIAENGALYLKICALFSFVLISNLIGIIPYGDTATSSLILTFWVALSVFGALVTLMLRKHGVNYFFSLFRPAGCPLALVFLLVPIEFLSYSFRLVSLSVRLFANMIAGHTLIKVLIGFSYVIFTLGDGYAIAAFLPAIVVFVLIFLEIAVAVIQTYIFTILTCIYLKDIYVAHA